MSPPDMWHILLLRLGAGREIRGGAPRKEQLPPRPGPTAIEARDPQGRQTPAPPSPGAGVLFVAYALFSAIVFKRVPVPDARSR